MGIAEINQKSTTILQLGRLREVLDNCSIRILSSVGDAVHV